MGFSRASRERNAKIAHIRFLRLKAPDTLIRCPYVPVSRKPAQNGLLAKRDFLLDSSSFSANGIRQM